MPDVLVARQPIFDLGQDVVGYELLFRAGADSETAVIGSPEAATSTVLLNSFAEIGLDQIVGTKAAWINVTREFLLGDLAYALPPTLAVLEIPMSEVIDEQLLAALSELKGRGYRLALDGFVHTAGSEPLLALADVVKLDVLALGREGLAREIAHAKPFGVTMLAQKVETREEYAYCTDAGCELLQGYFFCRPEPVRGHRVDANRLALLEVLAALQDPSAQLSGLERLIARDVGLSYRLLRYINSPFFGVRQQVRSIGQALALLGIENLRQWAALSVFASIDGKPSELTMTALIRGRFCELAGSDQHITASRGELFTLGLFSVLDALTDTPIEEVIEQMPFPDDIRDALVDHAGEKGWLLECIIALEAGAIQDVEALIPTAAEVYLASLTWANCAAAPLLAA